MTQYIRSPLINVTESTFVYANELLNIVPRSFKMAAVYFTTFLKINVISFYRRVPVMTSFLDMRSTCPQTDAYTTPTI